MTPPPLSISELQGLRRKTVSPVPVFEIGVWNAWIFMVYDLLPWPVLALTRRGPLRPPRTAVRPAACEVTHYPDPSFVAIDGPSLYNVGNSGE